MEATQVWVLRPIDRRVMSFRLFANRALFRPGAGSIEVDLIPAPLAAGFNVDMAIPSVSN